MTKSNAWYVRRNNQIKGPFPAGQIAQSLILGRFSLQDEVSLDRQDWKRISNVPVLVPEVLKADPDDEEAQERLKAARRWADERRSWHKSSEEHRESEGDETLEYRQHREHVLQDLGKRKEKAVIQLIIVVLIAAGLIYLSFDFSPQQTELEVNCDAPPSKGVNWQYCRMAGKQLIKSDLRSANLNTTVLSNANLFAADLSGANASYSDLSLANLSFANFTAASLKGANLQRADLNQATLTDADLSYADLRDAILIRTHFENTRLDHAIWIDGRVCDAGSVDVCKVSSP